jgi:DNA-binding Xre family transcriptional regulator
MTNTMTIRERIRARIAERGIKTTWLADQAGINKSALYSFLSGKRGIPFPALQKIFEILEL